MTNLTPEELSEGEKLLGAATSEPWVRDGHGISSMADVVHGDGWVVDENYVAAPDAAAIVWLRNNAPALIAEIRRMRDDSWVRKYNTMRREVRALNRSIRCLVAELPQIPCDLCGAAKDEVCTPGCESYS